MLGSLGDPTLPRRAIWFFEGDNAMGAGDQQERLVRLGWVIGFVDGEGCFCIGFVSSPIGLDDEAIGPDSR